MPSYKALDRSLKVDVAIVGAGITGLTAAYLLSQTGKSVVVLEKEAIASGASAYTTGFLCQVIDTDLSDAIDIWDIETTGKVLEGHKAAIDTIEKIVREERIACEFVRCPNFVYADSAEELQDEYEAAKHLSLPVTLAKEPDLGFEAQGAIEVADQAKFHPLKYLKGLAETVTKSGVRIFENTEVHDIEEGRLLFTEHALVEAKHILFATHKPFQQPPGLFFRKGTYTTHIFELEIPKDALPEGTYEDTQNPYHYFRVDNLKNKARVLVGGEDHRKDIPVPKRISEMALEDFVEETFGHLDYTIVDRSRGPILEPSDGLPVIGPYRYDSTFYASGFSGNGLTYGTLSALMFADHVEGRENPWQEIFAPGRFPYLEGLLVKGRDYMGELAHGALHNVFSYAPRLLSRMPFIRFLKARLAGLLRNLPYHKKARSL